LGDHLRDLLFTTTANVGGAQRQELPGVTNS
jgi:hypothetical protein